MCPASDIRVMDANGRHVVPLTHDFGNNLSPRWSPSGRRIAFSHEADVDSPADIYVMRRDGSGLTNVTDDPDHDTNPAWRPVRE